MLSWDEDKSEIINNINNIAFSDFIVAVKNKNEGQVLKEWLDHYIEIFGADSILIFDNGSDEKATLDIISSYEQDIGLALRYSNLGYDHNIIHNTKVFGELYSAIKKKCKYFALFDADELLTFFEGKQIAENDRVIEELYRVAERTDYNSLIFCYWLMAKQGRRDEFDLPHDVCDLFSGVKNGKYFIPSHRLGDVFISHNHSCPSDLVGYFSSQSLWLLHYQQSDIERRIRVNYEKIKARGMFPDDIGVNDIMTRPGLELLLHQDNRTATSHMKQICSLVDVLQGKGPTAKGKKSKGSITINGRGSVEFSDSKAETLFSEFLSGFYSSYTHAYFKSGLAKFFRHTRMIDLCVFGEVSYSTDGYITGWLFDLVTKNDPVVGFFYKETLLQTVTLTGENACFVEDGAIRGGFKISKSDLKDMLPKSSILKWKGNLIEVKHLRTMKVLLKGLVKI